MKGAPGSSATAVGMLRRDLAGRGVRGLALGWIDYCGIPRARIAPIGRLEEVAVRGLGATTLAAVFDTHDAITYAHEGLATPSGDTRLVPLLDRVVALAGQPALAWAPARVLTMDGEPWPYDPRGALEAQLARAERLGLEVRAGYEIEMFVGEDAPEPRPAHRGPAYGAAALTELDGFVAQLLGDLADNGLRIGSLHAEYGLAQLELALPAADPLSAADDQLLARQTIRAAARAHGLRVSFAPLITAEGVGQGWHLHTSVLRDGRNLLAGDGPHGMSGPGAAYVAGLLRDLPAIAAVSAPSVPSLTRIRPGYFAGAYSCWGVENREAPLRLVPATELLGDERANIELKVSDASANPHLAIAAALAAGLAGIEDELTPPEPIQEDPGRWSAERREQAGLALLPGTQAEQEAALRACDRVTAALGPERLGAFLAVRRADAAWAADRSSDEVVAAHLWRY